MSSVKGNKFWMQRSKHGYDRRFTPERLWESACEYFEWVEDNPIICKELVKFQLESALVEVPKMRAMTLGGLYRFVGLSESTFLNYEKLPEYKDTIDMIRGVIFEQKFTGAAAGELNQAIIARELNLADKKDHTSSDGSMTPRTLDDFYAKPDTKS
jgi:hypothetical protein